jgi:predicted helicase
VSLPRLRDYQQHAHDAVVAGLADGGRGRLYSACGTGKTLMGLSPALQLAPSGLIAVACPSLPLIAQTLKVWAELAVPRHVLAVCSDDTVTDTTTRVEDLPCQVTTDRAVNSLLAAIREWNASTLRSWYCTGAPVHLTTAQDPPGGDR